MEDGEANIVDLMLADANGDGEWVAFYAFRLEREIICLALSASPNASWKGFVLALSVRLHTSMMRLRRSTRLYSAETRSLTLRQPRRDQGRPAALLTPACEH